MILSQYGCDPLFLVACAMLYHPHTHTIDELRVVSRPVRMVGAHGTSNTNQGKSKKCASLVVCVDAGDTTLVIFWLGEEGWPSKYTRFLVKLFLCWISELLSVLYSGITEQTDCYEKKYLVAKSVCSANDRYG